MQLPFDPPSVLDYFTSLVQSDDGFGLFEAAASLAQDEYPGLDLQGVLGEVDQLLARVRRRLPLDAGPLQRFRVLNQFFYVELGFGGNLNDFYDPENSYLHAVLQTRRGIPISLAVLWLELGQGLGLSARGVAFPGHFLLKVNLPLGQVVMDPMTGRTLSREQLSERIEPFRQTGEMPDEGDSPLSVFLQASPPRNTLARMLHNLKEIHRAQQDWERLLAVQERLVILLPSAWDELRDRGLAHAELGHMQHAVSDLEAYLAHATDLTDMDAVADRLDALRRQKN